HPSASPRSGASPLLHAVERLVEDLPREVCLVHYARPPHLALLSHYLHYVHEDFEFRPSNQCDAYGGFVVIYPSWVRSENLEGSSYGKGQRFSDSAPVRRHVRGMGGGHPR